MLKQMISRLTPSAMKQTGTLRIIRQAWSCSKRWSFLLKWFYLFVPSWDSYIVVDDNDADDDLSSGGHFAGDWGATSGQSASPCRQKRLKTTTKTKTTISFVGRAIFFFADFWFSSKKIHIRFHVSINSVIRYLIFLMYHSSQDYSQSGNLTRPWFRCWATGSKGWSWTQSSGNDGSK